MSHRQVSIKINADDPLWAMFDNLAKEHGGNQTETFRQLVEFRYRVTERDLRFFANLKQRLEEGGQGGNSKEVLAALEELKTLLMTGFTNLTRMLNASGARPRQPIVGGVPGRGGERVEQSVIPRPGLVQKEPDSDYEGKGTAQSIGKEIDPKEFSWKSVGQYTEWCDTFGISRNMQVILKIRQKAQDEGRDGFTGKPLRDTHPKP